MSKTLLFYQNKLIANYKSWEDYLEACLANWERGMVLYRSENFSQPWITWTGVNWTESSPEEITPEMRGTALLVT